MSALVEVTNAFKVALLLVLVASTRNSRLDGLYSARVIETVSVPGLIVSVAERELPFKLAVIVAVVAVWTCVVLTVKFAELAPAATVTLGGTVAAALLLDSRPWPPGLARST
jgi:hypothetical protein